MATTIAGDFEWDDLKAEENDAKHGVSFEAAALALSDVNSIDDPDFDDPSRVVSIALNPMTGILYVVWTDGSAGRTRIISARKAQPNEQQFYKANLVR